MLKELKQFDADRLQLDELLALAAFGSVLHQEYDKRSIAAPEWLDDRVRELNREIQTRSRDALELRLKEIRAQKTNLLTAAEKRAALEAEEAKLTAQLQPANG